MRLLPQAVAKNFCIPKACKHKADWENFLHLKNRDKHLGINWMRDRWDLNTISHKVDPTNLDGLVLRQLLA